MSIIRSYYYYYGYYWNRSDSWLSIWWLLPTILAVFLVPPLARKIIESTPSRVKGSRHATPEEKKMRIRTFSQTESGDVPTDNNKPDA